ncbi:transglutaminase-like domain-containing protein [Butyrivibrio sp. AE2015]|uniref:transglutaminase-like domain-containing protein n=1 Tax=Butyrivibrio sp. AE2015 TaxID=1280663 RepID=UPI0003B4DD82|nr:transglutaminase-like domain-containing protein [Butyrivibrio sp. AE2015]
MFIYLIINIIIFLLTGSGQDNIFLANSNIRFQTIEVIEKAESHRECNEESNNNDLYKTYLNDNTKHDDLATNSWHIYQHDNPISVNTVINYHGKGLSNFGKVVAVGTGIRKNDGIVPTEADYGFVANVIDKDTISIENYNNTDKDVKTTLIYVEKSDGNHTNKFSDYELISGYSKCDDGFGYITVTFSTGKELSIGVLKFDEDLYVCNIEDYAINSEALVQYRKRITEKMQKLGITPENSTNTNYIYYPIVAQANEKDDVPYWLDMAEKLTEDSWTNAHKVMVFYNYIRENIAYDQWIISQGEQTRWKLYNSYDGSQYISHIKVGVCQDVSHILAIMCRNEGIPAVVVANGNHMWTMVYLYNRWVTYDITNDMIHYAYNKDPAVWTDKDNKNNYIHIEKINSIEDIRFIGIGNYEDMKAYGVLNN